MGCRQQRGCLTWTFNGPAFARHKCRAWGRALLGRVFLACGGWAVFVAEGWVCGCCAMVDRYNGRGAQDAGCWYGIPDGFSQGRAWRALLQSCCRTPFPCGQAIQLSTFAAEVVGEGEPEGLNGSRTVGACGRPRTAASHTTGGPSRASRQRITRRRTLAANFTCSARARPPHEIMR